MEVQFPRCAGLDVHKESIVACARWMAGGVARHEVRTFGTMTPQLLELADWLRKHQCTHVAMEATGIYWRPVWAVLDGDFELILANAKHVKNVPGRKTDVNDATWLSDLLAHGLIQPSFVPPMDVQAMRSLSRTRRQLVEEITAHTLRIQKLLETGNVKLSSVLSDVLGESGRAILNALANGTTDPNALLKLVNYRVKAPREKIRDALHGTLRDEDRLILKMHLRVIDTLQESVRELEARLGSALDPFREKVERIIEIPGFERRSASAVLAEIGLDMSRFQTPQQLVSWAKLCPRMDESAGKRRDTRIGKGSNWLKPVLIQTAWCAVRKKDSYLRAKYMRLKNRRGAKKAIVAVAASILRIIWHILAKPLAFKELGPEYFAGGDTKSHLARLTRRLNSMGYTVVPKAA